MNDGKRSVIQNKQFEITFWHRAHNEYGSVTNSGFNTSEFQIAMTIHIYYKAWGLAYNSKYNIIHLN